MHAPMLALEYVVAHEVAHLLHRNHSQAFWASLGETMPEWAEAKALLEAWEVGHRAVGGSPEHFRVAVAGKRSVLEAGLEALGRALDRGV